MKKLILIALLTATISVNAQNQKTTIENPSKEIGIRFNEMKINSNIDFVFKKQMKYNPNKYMRYRIAMNENMFTGNINLCSCDKNTFNYSLAIGNEYRVNFTNKFRFIHGLEFSLNTSGKIDFNNLNNKPLNRFNINPQLGYFLGFQYQHKNLIFTLEHMPTAVEYDFNSYTYYNTATEKRTRGWDQGFNPKFGFKPKLTVTYKF